MNMEGENESIEESNQTTTDLQENENEVQEILEEMRQKGPILAHPIMYVSALHNKQARYPVNQDDEFFKRNGIEFIELPPKEENPEVNPAKFKYLVNLDDTGSFRHSFGKID